MIVVKALIFSFSVQIKVVNLMSKFEYSICVSLQCSFY